MYMKKEGKVQFVVPFLPITSVRVVTHPMHNLELRLIRLFWSSFGEIGTRFSKQEQHDYVDPFI